MSDQISQIRGDSLVVPPLALAMMLFAGLSVLGVLLRPAMPIDETRYLTVAWEMRLSGDWLVPHLNGLSYSHKPPLLFWLINLVWLVTGPSETAARLVAPAFGFASVWATARLARKLVPDEPEISGHAALALSGMLGFSFFAGLTMFDAMQVLATVLGVTALTGVASRGRAAWLGWGTALALGALAKGPVTLVHLLPVALTTPLWAGTDWRSTAKGLALGLLTGLGLVALWLGPALVAGGSEYRTAVLWTQSAGRVVDSFAHQKPIWFFLAMMPLLIWPWGWSLASWRAARLTGPLAVWALADFAIFSLISGKQAHYLLPMLPALAIAFAPTLAVPRMPMRLAAILPLDLALLLGAIMLGLGPKEWGIAAQPLAPALLATALALTAALLVWSGGIYAAMGSCALILSLSVLFLGQMTKIYDAGNLGHRLSLHDMAGVGLVSGDYAGEFNYAGRLEHPVRLFDTPEAGLAWLAECPARILVMPGEHGPQDRAASDVITFRSQNYGLWLSPDQDQQDHEACR
ncbi:glycosyltransferase family 39 protein, partial [Paracoccus sp. MBLB3053]